MATGDALNVAAEIAMLRGELEVGFARLEGQLNLITQQHGQVREDIADLDEAVGALDKRVSALEERRWPVGQMAAVGGVVGTVAAVAALWVK